MSYPSAEPLAPCRSDLGHGLPQPFVDLPGQEELLPELFLPPPLCLGGQRPLLCPQPVHDAALGDGGLVEGLPLSPEVLLDVLDPLWDGKDPLVGLQRGQKELLGGLLGLEGLQSIVDALGQVEAQRLVPVGLPLLNTALGALFGLGLGVFPSQQFVKALARAPPPAIYLQHASF